MVKLDDVTNGGRVRCVSDYDLEADCIRVGQEYDVSEIRGMGMRIFCACGEGTTFQLNRGNVGCFGLVGGPW